MKSRQPNMHPGYGSKEISDLAGLDALTGSVPVPVILVEGIRALPEEHVDPVRACGAMLATRYPAAIFRTGNAPGTDAAFAEGVAAVAPDRLQLVLPYTGHRKNYLFSGSSAYALDGLPQAAEDRVTAATSEMNRDVARLTELYRKSGRTTAAGNKAAYLLRDTLKVIGAPEAGLAPATIGIFYVNEADPLSGGTGHTVRVCVQHQTPVVFQNHWLTWH
jgi:hypothetical protein